MIKKLWAAVLVLFVITSFLSITNIREMLGVIGSFAVEYGIIETKKVYAEGRVYKDHRKVIPNMIPEVREVCYDGVVYLFWTHGHKSFATVKFIQHEYLKYPSVETCRGY